MERAEGWGDGERAFARAADGVAAGAHGARKCFPALRPAGLGERRRGEREEGAGEEGAAHL
jgi:hypothetical protein